MLPSHLKRQLVSQSSKVGPERCDRELAYMIKFYNDSIDVRRGKRQQDFMWGRTRSEEWAKKLWTNVDGDSPGGNQHMASEVSLDGAPLEVIPTCLLRPCLFPLFSSVAGRAPSVVYRLGYRLGLRREAGMKRFIF